MPATISGNTIDLSAAFDASFSLAFDSSGCTCCLDETCDCPCCPAGYWSEYTFTISGITNNHCSDCTSWNGTWTLKWVGGCTWQTDEVAPTPSCGVFIGGEPMWTLWCFKGTWVLQTPMYEGIALNSVVTDPVTDYCQDGGDMVGGGARGGWECLPVPEDLTTTINPSGVFVPCP